MCPERRSPDVPSLQAMPRQNTAPFLVRDFQDHVNRLLFAEGGGGGGGFLARDGGGGGGPLIFDPPMLPCDVAGETEASP